MIFGLYAIRDAKTTFMPCTVDYNDASAIRNFEHAVQASDSLMASHPNDYALFKVGMFDNEIGEVSQCFPPVMLCDACNVLRGE